MYSSLADAPAGERLIISRISDPELEARMGRMGLFTGSEVVRLDEDVALKTVRVRGPEGEVVLGGGMGGKVVAHLDDGRMLPLTEMQPGERGHVECVTAHGPLREGMKALGLKDDDPIELIRALPPMEYIALVEGRGRIRMAEGMAAKILGTMEGIRCQFANAGVGAKFEVEQIIGGRRAQRAIASLDIKVGSVLQLEGVGEAQIYNMGNGNRCVISGKEGLRLFLRRDQADMVIVSYEEGGDS